MADGSTKVCRTQQEVVEVIKKKWKLAVANSRNTEKTGPHSIWALRRTGTRANTLSMTWGKAYVLSYT